MADPQILKTRMPHADYNQNDSPHHESRDLDHAQYAPNLVVDHSTGMEQRHCRPGVGGSSPCTFCPGASHADTFQRLCQQWHHSAPVHLRRDRPFASPALAGSPRRNPKPGPHRGRPRRPGPRRSPAHLGTLGRVRHPAKHPGPPRGRAEASARHPGRHQRLAAHRLRRPCPPIGRHRYFFRLYALDTVLPDLQRPDKDRLQAAMGGHVLATAALMGRYAKGDR